MCKVYLSLLLTTLFFTLNAQSKITHEEEIDQLFKNYTPQTPGVAVGILKNGKFIFQKGYGAANLEYDIPITPTTVFHVASVSKQFTAFAIYLLANEKRLSLEDDVRKYIPELPDYGTTMKIKHLLAHTSGLRDQFALLLSAGWDMSDVMTKTQILNMVFAQKALNFEPGSRFQYSNTGYTLLAEIVERVSHQSLNEFCQERIFQPLEMQHTQFYDDYKKVVKNRAYSYELRDNLYVKKKLNYSHVGATSLFTTVEDLAKWANNYEEPKVGNPKLLQAFNEPSILNNGKATVWKVIGNDTLLHAKGQFIRDYRGVKIFKHGGHDAGYRTFLARFPEEVLTIITLSNDEHYEIFARGLDIAEFYLKDQLQAKEVIESSPSQMTKKSFDMTTIDLKKYEGKFYSEELKTTYVLKVIDQQLWIQHQRLKDMQLSPIAENKFWSTNYFSFNLEFIEEQGDIKGFELSNFGLKNLFFERHKK
ncbi:MAG: serine hydrolase domain-containing protein [Bacteroidota bacterium]